MTSKVLKCNNCNLVVNEVLSFIQNKMDVMDEESLVAVCASAFPEEDIKEAKSLLFESVSQRSVLRKGDRKANKNLYDIITLLKETDPEEIPVFVARDLQKLPPVTFDHIDVTRLLKDIVLIQNELRDIQEKCLTNVQYATVDELKLLKLEIDHLKSEKKRTNNIDPNVNVKRGGYCMQDSFTCNSGPMGFMQCTQGSVTEHESPIAQAQVKELSSESSIVLSSSYASRAKCTSNSQRRSATSDSIDARVEATGMSTAVSSGAKSAVSPSSEAPSASPYKQPAQVVGCGQQRNVIRSVRNVNTQDYTSNEIRMDGQRREEESDEGEWVEVKKRRSKRFKGKLGCAPVDSMSKFRAADIKIPLFIYNVSKDTTVTDIEDYVRAKTSIRVTPEKVSMKYSKDYDSYKIYIPRSKLDVFEKDDFWPNGIYFRRYIIFKARQKGSVAGKEGSVKCQDGCEK